MSSRQSCKYCGAEVGVHQHSFNCPRFEACKLCGGDLGLRGKKRGTEDYHPWCAMKIGFCVIFGS